MLNNYTTVLSNKNYRPDWSVNDESNPAFVKNRPFYTPDVVETVLLEETTIDMGSGGNRTGLFTLPSGFDNDQKYKVVWDGVSYTCTAKLVQPFGISIGNASLASSGSGSGEPFLIGKMSGGYITFASGGLHTISISMIESDAAVVKLPIEYHQNSNILNGGGTGSLRTAGAFSSSGTHSFAEGGSTTASGIYSHAEGYHTTASHHASHTEGDSTTASGKNSHAEGDHTTASGWHSHAEGMYTTARGDASHAEGDDTIAASKAQHAQGKYNIADASNTYAHIVGNGTSDSKRSNAHTLDWDGNAWFAGDIYVGSTSGTNKDEGSKKLVTVDDIAQADWDVNDPENPAYVKNRPFYASYTTEVIANE